MVNRSLIRSGFDIEVLLSERYLRYVLLTQIEAGILPTVLDLVDPSVGLDIRLTLHPPTDYERLYEPHPEATLPPPADGSFACTLLFDDSDGANLQVNVITDILDNISGRLRRNMSVGLMLEVTLASTVVDRVFESDHRLSLALIKLDPVTQVALSWAGQSVPDVTERIRTAFDRTVPFGVAAGQSVQQVVLRVLAPEIGRPAALGVYINLALKNGSGPDDFVARRGDVFDAVNFLDDGRDLAFSTSAALFKRLGPDSFFRMAEEDPSGSGIFHHPLREEPGNRDSKVIGRLKEITIGAEPAGPAGSTRRLLVNVHGEYKVDVLPSPNFNLLVFLEPKVNEGLLSWDSEAKVDVHLLNSLPGIASILAVTLLLGVGHGALLLGILFLADLGIDLLATALAAEQADRLRDATFLDALPHRVAVAQRQWDPLYLTKHQLVALVNNIVIDELGLAFDGDAMLDKQPDINPNAVVRDESRDTYGRIDGLHYRVPDLTNLTADLVAIAPGTDRSDFAFVDTTSDPGQDPNVVALSLNQIADRISADRIKHPILYIPSKIHLTRNTIDSILLLSVREYDEQRKKLIKAFRRTYIDKILAGQGAAITDEVTTRLSTDLGREPTVEEVTEGVAARVEALADAAQPGYETGQLLEELPGAIDRILRFDARPDEIAALQKAGVMVLAGKEIIHMRSGSVYYRDRPDFFRRDNLLALPRYRLPY